MDITNCNDFNGFSYRSYYWYCYHKEIWSKDYQQQINDFNGDDGNYETDILLQNEWEEVEEDDSESQIIGDIKTKTFTRNGAIC